jgi:hypothetical protein
LKGTRIFLLLVFAGCALAFVAGTAGAAGTRTAFNPTAGRESTLVSPLNRRGEKGRADRSKSFELGKFKKNNGIPAPIIGGTSVDGSNASVSFDGATMYDQRTLNGFYLEPPDQGLCVSRAEGSGGRILEVVNDVAAVYDFAGHTLEKQTLNSFFGYPELLAGGPLLTDPSCYYDEDTRAWFVVELTLEVDPATGQFTGANQLDIAVSSPTNHDPATTSWKVYSIPTEDNGALGTPNHHCDPAPGPPPPYVRYPTACLGDYPHIGADKYGFYITTNEYSFFGELFTSAQIYALSKRALAENRSNVGWVHFENTRLAGEKHGPVGFTIWPAISADQQYNLENGGTEFFLSSTAAEETGNRFGANHTIGVWAITNTQSLDTPHPDLRLTSHAIKSEAYAVPPLSDQPHSGTTNDDFPLGQCLNLDECALFLLGVTDPYKPEVIGVLDSNDTRMQQVYYAAGRLWGALDTRVLVAGEEKAGVAYFIVQPVITRKGTVDSETQVVRQGYVGVASNNVIYPAIAANTAGRGVMAMTLVGEDHYPSAADIRVDLGGAHGPIFVPGRGVGVQDGFTEYKFFGPFADQPGVPRPRWGDYGAADEDGGSIWIGSEYIGQRCTFEEYINSVPFGSCGATRRALGNWYTRISHVTP